MKFPALFRRPKALAPAADAQDRAERLLADSFRLLAQLCGKMADLVEAQRLSRSGYAQPGRFLERLDREPGSKDT